MYQKLCFYNLWAKFKSEDHGIIVPIVAVSMIPLMGLLGVSVDYNKASELRSRLQMATDAAALQLAPQAVTTTDAVLLQRANEMVKTISKDQTAVATSIEVTPGRTQIKIHSGTHYKTVFMNIPGFETLPLKAYASALASNVTYEIALVIDNSGSMGSTSNGKSKMQAAKDAAKRLVDSMYSTHSASERTKISVVPFTISVNLGSQYLYSSWLDRQGQSSIHWDNFDRTGTWLPASRFDLFQELGVDWGGCVETRPDSYAVSDAAPSGADAKSLFVPQFAPDEPGNRGSSNYSFSSTNANGYSVNTYWSYSNSYLDDNPTGTCVASERTTTNQYDQAQKKLCKYRNRPNLSLGGGKGPNHRCDAQTLLRMTSSKTDVKSSIDQMVASGNTNLLEGFTWGWRTISPHAPFADAKSYDEADNRKIIIFLTDGMNFWGNANNHNLSIFSPFGYYTNNRLASVTNGSQARTAMDEKTLQACNNAKAKGISVYTVGFSVPNDPIDFSGLQLLKSCATSQSMAFIANDSNALVSIFEEIARNIGSLRLSE